MSAGDSLLAPASGTTPDTMPTPRESMTLFENFLTVLMPVSVASTVFLVATSSASDLYYRVAAVAAFYGTWAVYNWLTTKPHEKGHYPLFICMIGCLVGNTPGKYIAISGAATTWFFFVVAGYMGVLTFPVSKLAHERQKTLYWAWVFKSYFIASLCSWAFIVYRLAMHA